MPRSEPLDDTTSLDASRINVGARIGWLLRVSRSTGGYSLRQMAAALQERGVRVSAASLSRIESEGHRSVAALEGYASVLGLPEGGLRVAVDTMCRSFSYAPPTQAPGPDPSLARFSAACRAVHADHPTGGDWLAFTRQHADDTDFGLPDHLMEPCLLRLSNELCRSVGLPRFLRYEALLWLRRSAYGDLVAKVVADLLRDPDIQVVEDLVTAVAEHPTAQVVAWTGELLGHPSVFVARSASYAIQSMLVAGGLELDDWSSLPPAMDRAWAAASGQEDHREVLSQLRAALPPPLEALLTTRDREPAPGLRPLVWTRDRQNVHYGFASTLAHEVTTSRGLPDDPMLARLLFESMFDPRGVRMASSTILLAASPYAADLVPVLLDGRSDGPDHKTRAAAARVAAFCHVSDELPDLETLLESENPEEFRHALRFFGDSGQQLPDAAVRRGLAGDETLVRHTLIALGLAGDPRLEAIASDTKRPESVRGAASWWLRQGPRITR